MPLLNDAVLKCSFYLYPSKDAANSGESRGASGFVISVLEQFGNRGLLYAVTAGHVIGQANTLRLNRIAGTPLVVTLPETRWHRSLNHDLAVAPLSGLPTNELNLFLMPLGLSLSRARCAEEGVGVGDDTFTVGRFLGHDGRERNLPTARFGRISMMPLKPIKNPTTGLLEESFLIESRSLPGYSGSPVFVYRDATLGPSTRLLGACPPKECQSTDVALS